ncbi:5-dehydro-4-deoxyglucarate dehydratase [Amycolatopsis sp. K13G38]|uniref:Probable 5-dehydro-4-deoxyglucarate dehydratase n=1 Tax=Amycolatopsis acididurans TaxID=2724524 RepID=A0ABX1JEJ6_9PSEU|nr:5-dehydro-4-deoxyglucarate dehydratase [Amycolatopsis acididurans]NKQ58158.1 5-dehydro-4-deoxyglucarate dehydratase [Amycolatopsis acididurans]
MKTADLLRARMGDGVLSFPLTSFTDRGELDPESFRAYLRIQLDADPAAVFVACGTGEFFSLTLDEYAQVVRIAVEETAHRVPVIAGLGYGWAMARQFARRAEEAGADGGLLLPHYLVKAPADGLVEQVRKVAEGTSLPLIAYQRDYVTFDANAVRLLAKIGGVIGLKDGHGDLDQLQRLRLAAPEDFLFFNGVATAEMQARAYRAIGIPAYSSAVHAFAPEIAKAFFTALREDDQSRVDELLRHFYQPFVELRDRRAGYAVSLVKAAARVRGLPVGPVRAPLTDPSPDELTTLRTLLSTGLHLV